MRHVLLGRFEDLLTRLSRSLNFAEGLVAPKSLKLEPLGVVAVLHPDGGWRLNAPGEWEGIPDAVVRWQPEQWAAWIKGVAAGWWSFSLQEGVAVEGDVAWVMGLRQRLRLFPWWWAAKTQRFGMISSLAHQCAQSAFRHGHTLLKGGGAALQDLFREEGWGVGHTLVSTVLEQQIEALHEAVERLEARCQSLERSSESIVNRRVS